MQHMTLLAKPPAMEYVPHDGGAAEITYYENVTVVEDGFEADAAYVVADMTYEQAEAYRDAALRADKTDVEMLAELSAKLDALMEFQGLTGRWDGSAFIVEKPTEFPEGDYLHPIPWTAGMTVELGLWYYADDPELPAECVQGGVAESYGAPWLDVVV